MTQAEKNIYSVSVFQSAQNISQSLSNNWTHAFTCLWFGVVEDSSLTIAERKERDQGRRT